MRLFVAVPLPVEIKNQLGKLIDDWRRDRDNIAWVKEENLHLTLKFLGEATERRLAPLKSGLSESLEQWEAFNISLKGAGGFPNLVRPRVLWIGVTEGRKNLRTLANSADEATRPLGFSPEQRDFSAHLTVGRVKGTTLSASLLGKLSSCAFEAKDVIVSEVVLFQSELAPGGSIYTPLASFELKR